MKLHWVIGDMNQQISNDAANTCSADVDMYTKDAHDGTKRCQRDLSTVFEGAKNAPLNRKIAHLRVALFSGNYNYTKDGANQALNKLVGYLEKRGAAVRVYSPTSDTPAFEPAGTLVSVPSIAIPGRSEYRFSLGLPRSIKADLEVFNPNIVHVSAPDLLCKAAVKFAKERNVSVVASVHTRFENYLKYYKLGWLEGAMKRSINRFYSRCDKVLAPNRCMETILSEEGVTAPIGTWGRGVDQALYAPTKRDMAWRRSLGIADHERIILFVGRLVREKGLCAFAGAIDALKEKGVQHRVMVVGDGPERDCFQKRLGDGVFTGFLVGEDLARAYASADVFLNPSLTEAFGNVMLEAMASGLPAVCAKASGSNSLIQHKINGLLVEPDNTKAFADALATVIQDETLCSKMQYAARDLAQAFTWPAVLETVIEQYDDIVGAQ